MKKLNRFAVLALFLLPVFTLGCKELIGALPSIVEGVVDGGLILDQIETFVRSYFVAHPDATKEANVEKAISKCRAALVATQRLGSGAGHVDKGETAAAIADFEAAYAELAKELQDVPGIHLGKPGEALQASHGELMIPAPILTKE